MHEQGSGANCGGFSAWEVQWEIQWETNVSRTPPAIFRDLTGQAAVCGFIDMTPSTQGLKDKQYLVMYPQLVVVTPSDL